jgi:septum formation protein
MEKDKAVEPVQLILASASPRRRELLSLTGASFTVVPAAVDESLLPAEDPEHYVRRLAAEKGRVVLQRWSEEGSEQGQSEVPLVVAADTVVVLGKEVLGKPGSPDEARRMLLSLQGRSHEVMTGFSVQSPSAVRVSVARTTVEFAPLSEAEIERYISTGEPFDKAGAYAIQGRGAVFVRQIHGSYTNVVGLPVVEVVEALGEFPEWGRVISS